MRRLLAPERRDLAVLYQDVVERDRDLPVRRWPVVGITRDDDQVAVEAHLLAIVLADVRVVPVDAGVGELDAGGKVAADWDRRLRLVRSLVAVLEPQPMPVDGALHVALVLDVDNDLRALLHFQRRPWNRAVVGEHPHRRVAELLGDRSDPQLEFVALGQLDDVGGAGLGKAGDLCREVIMCGAHAALLYSKPWVVRSLVAARSVFTRLAPQGALRRARSGGRRRSAARGTRRRR